MVVGKGQLALVTGANRGIGKEVCRQLAALGYSVILGSRSLEKGQAAVEDLLQHDEKSQISAVAMDVGSVAMLELVPSSAKLAGFAAMAPSFAAQQPGRRRSSGNPFPSATMKRAAIRRPGAGHAPSAAGRKCIKASTAHPGQSMASRR